MCVDVVADTCRIISIKGEKFAEGRRDGQRKLKTERDR
jgi:hypothetical protein